MWMTRAKSWASENDFADGGRVEKLMTAASPSPSGAGGVEARFIERVMVRIPAQWFWMGCETGRDDEKPVHRVWVDSFELAVHQVTNADYRCFLAATGAPA